MSSEAHARSSFWPVVKLLLRAARRRAQGRSLHQQKILNHRHKGKAGNWGALMVLLTFVLGFFMHGMFAVGINRALNIATVLDAESRGQLVVGGSLISALDELREAEKAGAPTANAKKHVDVMLSMEARSYAFAYGGDKLAQEKRFRAHFERHGPDGFIAESSASNGFSFDASIRTIPLAGLVGLLMLVWWFVMITFQGEGLELDVQRRRHPMWEWLLSHPVQPGAVFFAEMLSPLAANPNIIMAPMFWVILLLMGGHGFPASLVGGVLIGVPLAAAAACANKTLEINTMLRLSPRNRGAVLGFMSWLGYASFVSVFFIAASGGLMLWLERGLLPLAGWCDWSLFGWLLGLHADGPATWQAVLIWWTIAAALITFSVRASARATERGLSGGFGGTEGSSGASGHGGMKGAFFSLRFIKDVLYRKELFWFLRDRGAVVQTLLIPCTIAGFQAFNLRGLIQGAGSQWNWLCALAVVFGTYFLFILGPRSLVSEGPALWLALTWPRGLENLLKAKARLWWMMATAMVFAGLLVAAFMHPLAWWKILLVALGWWAFSHSLALKAVTLVQAPSSSGEPEPIPKGRQWAAMLGTFTFAAGIASSQWHLAIMGVVFSWVTGAAMWQNFRERLPFLYDAWSEKPPQPPTVTHALVAILAMIECVAISTAICSAFLGGEQLWFARALAYAGVGLLTWIFTAAWLKRRDVPNSAVWHWEAASFEKITSPRIGGGALLTGLGAGTLLGLMACVYSSALGRCFPEFAAEFNQTALYLLANPAEHWWFGALALVAAPLAEEYLFRGLLFRALDREWGGWKAVLGSALFFAIYHPPTSWPPVALLGVLNALLFRRSRRLWPCVLAHLAYNACVTLSLPLVV